MLTQTCKPRITAGISCFKSPVELKYRYDTKRHHPFCHCLTLSRRLSPNESSGPCCSKWQNCFWCEHQHLAMPFSDKRFPQWQRFAVYEMTYTNKYTYAQPVSVHVYKSFWLPSQRAAPLKHLTESQCSITSIALVPRHCSHWKPAFRLEGEESGKPLILQVPPVQYSPLILQQKNYFKTKFYH